MIYDFDEHLKRGIICMIRLLALFILVIPGLISVYGVKLMRDSVFGIEVSWIPSLWLQFLIGLVIFFLGAIFIGGFILHRDRKRNKVQKRFKV